MSNQVLEQLKNEYNEKFNRLQELVGGTYLCLAKPQQDEKTVISFDEEGSSPLADIKEKTEAFLDYLDSIFNTKEE